MISRFWPILLVVLSNVIYHVCTKSIPGNANTFASLTVSYIVAAMCSAILFLLCKKEGGIINELGKLNWTSYAIGLSIIGLEAGFLCAYKAGWPVSTASIVQSALLGIALIAAGYFLFNEELTLRKIIGVAICITGLVIINLR